MAGHCVRGTISLWVTDYQRWCRELLSTAQCRSLARYVYDGMVWLRQRKMSTSVGIWSASGNRPMQVMEQWSNTVILPSSVYQPCCCIEHRLEPVKHVRGNTHKSGTAIVQSRQYQPQHVSRTGLLTERRTFWIWHSAAKQLERVWNGSSRTQLHQCYLRVSVNTTSAHRRPVFVDCQSQSVQKPKRRRKSAKDDERRRKTPKHGERWRNTVNYVVDLQQLLIIRN